ncbi:hypothetical protein H4R35_001038 [Dimargaris xerosporica]|nr:hypothetical protein H4R35_001038 [Dimargaris xerosporica]
MAPLHGVIALVGEIASSPSEWIGRSVRVVGILKHYDASTDLAIIEQGGRMAVDTRLLGPFAYPLQSAVMFIGEVEAAQHEQSHPELQSLTLPLPILRARIARCVDGLDLHLYKSAIQIKRTFEQRWSHEA